MFAQGPCVAVVLRVSTHLGGSCPKRPKDEMEGPGGSRFGRPGVPSTRRRTVGKQCSSSSLKERKRKKRKK